MAKKQQRWCDHPATGSYSNSTVDVFVRGATPVPRSHQTKAVVSRGSNFARWQYIGHKPSVSKYLPAECDRRKAALAHNDKLNSN